MVLGGVMLDNNVPTKENSMSKKTKVIISVIAVVLILVGAFFLIKGITSADKNKEQSSSTTTSAVADAVASTSKSTTTSATTSNSDVDSVTKNSASVSSSKDKTDGSSSGSSSSSGKTSSSSGRTEADKASALPSGSKSILLNGDYSAKNRWVVSSAFSKATVERVSLKLPVYKNSKKTGKYVTKEAYVALINTKASKVNIVSSYQYTKKHLAKVDAIAKGYGALFAVNNEMCNDASTTDMVFYNSSDDTTTGTVIKDGKVAQVGYSNPSLVIYNNGTWKYPVDVSRSNASSLIRSGVKASVSYTYPLIWHGEKYTTVDGFNMAETEYNIEDIKGFSHTVIGKIDADNYVVIFSEGFGRGYVADLMLKYFDVQDAYWGSGGKSCGMYLKGYGLINQNYDGTYYRRKNADIFCVK